jgi:hypothetical protein
MWLKGCRALPQVGMCRAVLQRAPASWPCPAPLQAQQASLAPSRTPNWTSGRLHGHRPPRRVPLQTSAQNPAGGQGQDEFGNRSAGQAGPQVGTLGLPCRHTHAWCWTTQTEHDARCARLHAKSGVIGLAGLENLCTWFWPFLRPFLSPVPSPYRIRGLPTTRHSRARGTGAR